MCIFCSLQTNSQKYDTLFTRYIKTISRTQSHLSTVNGVQPAIKIAKSVDYFRFIKSPEWVDPNIAPAVTQHIFANPNPDNGFLLFTLCCWLSIQAKYTVVWTTYLQNFATLLSNLNSNQPFQSFPRSKFKLVAGPVSTTINLYQRLQQNISSWFMETVLSIANGNNGSIGNIYRFAARVCNDLYGLKDPRIIKPLTAGFLPATFTGGDYKRIWMYIMFLRRDNHAIKCLLTRALQDHSNGLTALQYWYDPQIFNPIECELPVDIRVKNGWWRFGRYFGASQQPALRTYQVANMARTIATTYNISPSIFDAILF